MGFLERSRDRLKLKARERGFKKNPSPQTLGEVIQAHVRMGNLDQAVEFSTWGVRRFPGSPILRELHRVVMREKVTKGLEESRREIEANPSEEGYLQLARLAVQSRDGATAIQALDRCVEQFPECLAALSGLAEIKERRFLRDLGPSDARSVIHSLRTGWRLEPANGGWPFKLAQFYERVGALQAARKVGESALQVAPDSEEVQRFLKALPVASDGEEDLEEILAGIEEQGYLPGQGEDAIRVQREVDRIRQGMGQLRNQLGAQRLVVISADGDAFDDTGAIPLDSFVRLTTNLMKSSHRTGRRAGLGPLRGATLETAGGTLVLRRGYRSTVACLLPKETSIKGSQEALGKLLVGELNQPT